MFVHLRFSAVCDLKTRLLSAVDVIATVSWFCIITRERWFRVHIIHVEILSISVISSVRFPSLYIYIYIYIYWLCWLNWIDWNKCFWNLNCLLMLNWIVWNRTVLCIKMDLALNNLQWLICHKPNQNLWAYE